MQALHGSPRLEAKALQLLLLTGARKSEILKARWEHIHLEKHLPTVPLSKSNRPRHIVLSDEAVAIIRLLPRRPDCPWLFPGRTAGRPLSDIYLFWNHLRRQLNLADVRIHDLRHTFASILVNAGHSLYEVQRLLGHRDPRTTMRYAHLGHDSLLAAGGYGQHIPRKYIYCNCFAPQKKVARGNEPPLLRPCAVEDIRASMSPVSPCSHRHLFCQDEKKLLHRENAQKVTYSSIPTSEIIPKKISILPTGALSVTSKTRLKSL